MSRFAKGWIPNVRPFAHTFSGVHPLLRAGVALDGSDLTAFTPPQMDQGGEPACVGHATSCTAFTSFSKAGTPLLWVPSMAWIYRIANAVTRAAQGLDPATNPLPNQGAMPSDAMTGLAQYGLKAMGPQIEGRFSDSDATTDVAEPTQDELAAAFECSVESHAILPGANFVSDYCTALHEYGCPIGVFVDTAFENWDPMQGFIGAPNANDPNGGGHDLSGVGYIPAGKLAQGGAAALPAALKATAAQAAALAQAASKLAATHKLVIIKNSWVDAPGVPWGMNGYCIVNEDFLTAPTTSDANAILPVKKEVSP